MLNKQGFRCMDLQSAQLAIADCERNGWAVFRLPDDIASRDDFLDGVRSVLPLDPPLQSNFSWDALDDSLWSGLHGLDAQEILIVWLNSGLLRESSPEDFDVAVDILGDLPDSLADPKYLGCSPAKRLLVLQVADY